MSPPKGCVVGFESCCEVKTLAGLAIIIWLVEYCKNTATAPCYYCQPYLILDEILRSLFQKKQQPMCMFDSRRYICLLLYIIKSHMLRML